MRRPILVKRKKGQRLGIRGYLFAVRELQKGPRIADDIVKSMGMALGGDNATLLMRRLRSVGLAHVSGWRKLPAGRTVAVFSFGPGDDVPAPSSLIKKAEAKAAINVTAITVKHLMRAVAGLASKSEIAQMTGIHEKQVGTIVNYMHEIGLVHIGAWMPSRRGKPVPLFMVGGTRDADRPMPREQEREKARQRKIDREGRVQMLTMIHATAANADQILEAA